MEPRDGGQEAAGEGWRDGKGVKKSQAAPAGTSGEETMILDNRMRITFLMPPA